jgi:single-stranded-DNA-specific exonuclease
LPASAFTLETAQLIRSSGPWGQGFPEPLFDGIFDCLSIRKLGDKHLKFVVSPPGKRMAVDAVMFNVPAESSGTGPVSRIRLVYRLDVNDYRGQQQLQLMVEYFEPL